jgi:hypothetical protein
MDDYFTLHFRQTDGSMKTYKIPLSKIKSIFLRADDIMYMYLTTGMTGPIRIREVRQSPDMVRMRAKGVKIFDSDSNDGW